VIVCTDSVAFAADLFGGAGRTWADAEGSFHDDLARFTGRLYGDRARSVADVPGPAAWSYVFAAETAERSQYDLLVDAARAGATLPSGVACLAGSGRGFHGFRDRPWMALAGNVHLSAHLSVSPGIVASAADVMALAAVSVVEAIDGIPGLEGRAGIKWVNDVLIDEAKVCGILAHLEASDRGVTSIIVGIGLNVETTPVVPPTPFVPRVGALRAVADHPVQCDRRTVLAALLASLDRNYRDLLERGARALRERYRERSVVVGRRVTVCAEGAGPEPDVLADGTVAALGDRLELILRGVPQPFVGGRLILHPSEPPGPAPS
jgi:BirA family biotin operon repressor/biotin-[acetyl-CoA-carboxylase] ligase